MKKITYITFPAVALRATPPIVTDGPLPLMRPRVATGDESYIGNF